VASNGNALEGQKPQAKSDRPSVEECLHGKERKVIIIFGQRGSGKSYLAKKLVEGENRLILYDTLGEYDNGVALFNVADFRSFFLEHYRGDFRCIYNPLQPEKEFDAICEYAFDAGDLTFLVEELDVFCSANAVSPAFANIIQRGRHSDISFIGVSQRPFGINRIITAQAKIIYSFKQREPRDIDYLCSFMGDEANIVSELNQYEFMRWENGKITRGKV